MTAAAGAMLAAVSAQAAEPIKVGVLTPLSGTYAVLGQQIKWGMDLATEEINAAGGIDGRAVELVYEDSEANPAAATAKAERLIQVENVDVITGTVSSGVTLAVGQIAERNKTLLVTTVSFSTAITGSKCSPYVFRINANAAMQSNALAAWLQSEKPEADVFYLGPDYEMGRNTVEEFKKVAEPAGMETVGEIYAPLNTNDFSQYFGQVRASQPTVFYTSTGGNDSVRLLTQLAEYGLRDRFLAIGAASAVTPATIEAIGPAAEGFVTGVGYSPTIESEANQAFVAKFKEKFGAVPDLYGADSYGFMPFYKKAVEAAGSTDADAVMKAMEGLSWETVQGTKTIRAGDHQAMMPMYAVAVQDGRFEVIGRVEGEDAIGPDNCERF
jgi:branched-chain amino acid transport system substrate-binding protein